MKPAQPNITWIDSHCHFDQLPGTSKNSYKRAQTAGVKKLVIPGVNADTWKRSQHLSDEFDGVYFAVGTHPWKLSKTTPSEYTNTEQALFKNAQHSKCVAIGECGLDKTIEAPLEVQQAVLAQHIHWANQLKLPLIIHCVKAHNELIRMIKKEKPNYGGVIHAFSGSYETAKCYWDMGFYLGIGGIITYPRAVKTRNAVSKMPIESIVLETDAPFMPLAGNQGQPNCPSYLPQIAWQLAGLKSITIEQLAGLIEKNSVALFPSLK